MEETWEGEETAPSAEFAITICPMIGTRIFVGNTSGTSLMQDCLCKKDIHDILEP